MAMANVLLRADMVRVHRESKFNSFEFQHIFFGIASFSHFTIFGSKSSFNFSQTTNYFDEYCSSNKMVRKSEN